MKAYIRELADRLSKAKRLTDAELAAEYWELSYGAEVTGSWAIDYSRIKEANHRTEVMKRFATLPHASENGYA